MSVSALPTELEMAYCSGQHELATLDLHLPEVREYRVTLVRRDGTNGRVMLIAAASGFGAVAIASALLGFTIQASIVVPA